MSGAGARVTRLDHTNLPAFARGCAILSAGGGGDTRFDVGTVARVAEAAELADGRWVLAVVGVRRIRIAEWLPESTEPNNVHTPFWRSAAMVVPPTVPPAWTLAAIIWS